MGGVVCAGVRSMVCVYVLNEYIYIYTSCCCCCCAQGSHGALREDQGILSATLPPRATTNDVRHPHRTQYKLRLSYSCACHIVLLFAAASCRDRMARYEKIGEFWLEHGAGHKAHLEEQTFEVNHGRNVYWLYVKQRPVKPLTPIFTYILAYRPCA
jgi:hypothetical protein